MNLTRRTKGDNNSFGIVLSKLGTLAIPVSFVASLILAKLFAHRHKKKAEPKQQRTTRATPSKTKPRRNFRVRRDRKDGGDEVSAAVTARSLGRTMQRGPELQEGYDDHAHGDNPAMHDSGAQHQEQLLELLKM